MMGLTVSNNNHKNPPFVRASSSILKAAVAVLLCWNSIFTFVAVVEGAASHSATNNIHKHTKSSIVRNNHNSNNEKTRTTWNDSYHKNYLPRTTTNTLFHQNIQRGGGGGGSQRQKQQQGTAVTTTGGTASVPSEIFNLVKNIVGAGVLSLPAGIAAFGNSPTAVLPAVMLITFIGGLSAYGFSLIGRVCATTGAKSFREAWDETVGPSSSWIVAFSSLFSCFCANLAYGMILADTFQNLLQSIGGGFFTGITRTQALLGVTGFLLVPLCLLRDLSALAPFSLLGIIGMAYTSLAMIIRYLDDSYGVAKTGANSFIRDLSVPPKFGTDRGAMSVFSPKASILLGMLSTAYMAHFNAPKFFVELKNNTVQRYNIVTYSSFGISIAIFSIVAAVGFWTFGESCNGLILNNYSNNDPLMSLSRIAVAISIVFSYPLVFVGAREGLFDLAQISIDKRSSLVTNATLGMIGILTLLAFLVKDLSFVLSFSGATLGNALIYVFPAVMFRKMRQQQQTSSSSIGVDVEVGLAMISCLFGIVMGTIGAVQSVKSLSS